MKLMGLIVLEKTSGNQESVQTEGHTEGRTEGRTLNGGQAKTECPTGVPPGRGQL